MIYIYIYRERERQREWVYKGLYRVLGLGVPSRGPSYCPLTKAGTGPIGRDRLKESVHGLAVVGSPFRRGGVCPLVQSSSGMRVRKP